MQWIKRHPRLTGAIAVFVVLGAILSATTSGKSNSNLARAKGRVVTHSSATTAARTSGKPHISVTEASARSYTKALGFDARRVQASVQTVLITVGEFQQSKTKANVERLARAAQGAHGELNDLRGDFAADAPNATGRVENAEREIWHAANDLKNSMGSLATLAENPNPATETQFSAQYPPARAEWNSGIRTIWRLGRESGAPTI